MNRSDYIKMRQAYAKNQANPREKSLRGLIVSICLVLLCCIAYIILK